MNIQNSQKRAKDKPEIDYDSLMQSVSQAPVPSPTGPLGGAGAGGLKKF